MAQMEGEEGQGFEFPETLDECQDSLAAARQQIDDLNDKYLRAAAQVQNVRKWTERDTLARVREEQRSLLRQLLEVMDNLDRALANPDAEAQTIYEGVQLTRRQMEKVLDQVGVRSIPVGEEEPFDPNLHEAVEVRMPAIRRGKANRDSSGSQPIILEVIQPGYIHEDQLLRPVRVVVAR